MSARSSATQAANVLVNGMTGRVRIPLEAGARILVCCGGGIQFHEGGGLPLPTFHVSFDRYIGHEVLRDPDCLSLHI